MTSHALVSADTFGDIIGYATSDPRYTAATEKRKLELRAAAAVALTETWQAVLRREANRTNDSTPVPVIIVQSSFPGWRKPDGMKVVWWLREIDLLQSYVQTHQLQLLTRIDVHWWR